MPDCTEESLLFHNTPSTDFLRKLLEESFNSRRCPEAAAVATLCQSGNAVASLQPAISGPGQLSTSIRLKLAAAFAKARPIEAKSDKVGLHDLLSLVAKARLILDEFDEPSRLLSDQVLGWAVALLPPGLAILYNRRCEHRTLSTLVFFIFNLLATADDVDLEFPPYANKPRFCNYCKKSGHLAFLCPMKKLLVCLHCFASGHIRKDCTNPPATPQEVLDSLH